MLAITERLTLDHDLNWAFCDTDSLAMAKPDGLSCEQFRKKVQSVTDWFKHLSPYKSQGSILQIELGFDEPLHCYAISAKRYALFELDNQNSPVIRKASAHGLGQLMAPYDKDAPQGIGVSGWQKDIWTEIIKSALAGHPNRVQYSNLDLDKPALQRYGATSPALLRWMKYYNQDKDYRCCVKPFGFLVSLMPRLGAFAPCPTAPIADPNKRGRPIGRKSCKPIAPFERDGLRAAEEAFDRQTGSTIAAYSLKTYREALALYHLSQEDKFENGGPWDCGHTGRRHIHVSATQLIGKEANKVGAAGECDPVFGNVVNFNSEKEAA